MSILGYVYFFFFKVFLQWFSNDYAVPFLPSNYDSTTFNGYDNIINKIDIVNGVYNIFAWVDVFVDLDFLFNLFFLTSLYYGLVFSIKLAKLVISFFRR